MSLDNVTRLKAVSKSRLADRLCNKCLYLVVASLPLVVHSFLEGSLATGSLAIWLSVPQSLWALIAVLHRYLPIWRPYDDCLMVLLWVDFCRLCVAWSTFDKPLMGTVPHLNPVSVVEGHHYENSHPKSHHSRNPQVCHCKSPSRVNK